MNKRRHIIAPFLSLSLLLTACNAESTTGEQTEKVAVNVQAEKVKMDSLDAISSLTGTLMPTKETKVSFELGGTVQSTDAEIGDVVQQGTILARLINDTYALQVKQSEASMSAANASILSAEARIQSAEANLSALEKGARAQERQQAKNALERAKAAYDKLKADTQRMKALYDDGLISAKDYEDMKFQLLSAEKDFSNAKQSFSMLDEGATPEQRQQLKAGVQEAKTGIAQAQASYEQALVGKKQAELTLGKTLLKAPLSGVILSKTITAGEQANPGAAVFTIGQTNQLKVLLPVPDRDIQNWKKGDFVNVSLYDEKRQGKVTRIYPQTNANTGTISVEVVIPNSNSTWLPGQIIKANRVSSDNVGVLIPIEAVISNGQDSYVFKVIKGKAVKITVTTGELVDNKIHIVKGLKEGETIITRGSELLLDGDPVAVGGGKK